MKRAIFAFLVLCVLLDTRPSAWGPAAHRVVSRAAIRALPSEVPSFLARQIDWIGSRSVLADTWRGPHEPFAKAAEDSNHVWYMEQFAFLKQIPRSRDEFVLAVYDEHLRLRHTDPARASLTNIHYTGTLPYAATEGYERLKVAFRTWRELRNEKQDTAFIEQDAAFYVGWLSHYIADGAQPLHTSIHHDGWVGDNPHNFTRDRALHWKFENTYVDLIALSEKDVQSRVPTTPARLPDPFTAVLTELNAAHARIEHLYELEQHKAFDDRDNREAREFLYACIGDAATLLRDLIYTAWLESSDLVPSFDADGQTNNPQNPRYNPATGSAPPPPPAIR